MKTKNLVLSRRRQRLAEEADLWLKQAQGLETKFCLIERERVENLRKAAFYRTQSANCKAELLRLRAGTWAQKLAGFTQGEKLK